MMDTVTQDDELKQHKIGGPAEGISRPNQLPTAPGGIMAVLHTPAHPLYVIAYFAWALDLIAGLKEIDPDERQLWFVDAGKEWMLLDQAQQCLASLRTAVAEPRPRMSSHAIEALIRDLLAAMDTDDWDDGDLAAGVRWLEPVIRKLEDR